MRRALVCCMAAWTVATSAVGADHGIEIVPGEDGKFVYTDDFETPKVLQDAFLTNTGPEVWTPGALSTKGPHRNRTVTWRFRGPRPIDAIDFSADQRANPRSLGGRTTLYLSSNGMDWTQVDTSDRIEADSNHWRIGPLVATGEAVTPFLGKNEVWVRLVMDNYSGLETSVSNSIFSVSMTITLRDEAAAASDPQAELRAQWGALRRETAWRALTFDWRDPIGNRAPFYFEDVDGWLTKPTDLHSATDMGFLIYKHQTYATRPVTGMGFYVETSDAPGPVMARLNLLSGADAFRDLAVYWDGKLVASLDPAGFFEEPRSFLATLADSPGAGIHEIRISPNDTGSLHVQGLSLAGAPVEAWAGKPALPEGGTLELLSAYYMPDPAPPVNSQTVEGRKKPDMSAVSPGVGLTFKGMQRLYKEHTEFGGLRMVVRNTGDAPVRIAGPVLLNGAPAQDAFIDFVNDAWDAPGVVWYRVRPRTVAPGQCAQVYIRFRKRLEGDAARVAVSTEGGQSLEAAVPYTNPGVNVDYVATSKDYATLYIYARRVEGMTPGNLTGVSLDGVLLDGAEILGEDYPGGLALAVARLPEPLAAGDYHVASIHTADGAHIAAQFRVVPFFYPRSSIHVPSEMCKDMHMNLGMWHMRSLEDCQKHGILTSAMHHEVFGVHERVACVIGPDEPDAKDNPGGGYDKGLGWTVHNLARTGWQQLAERFDAPVPSWMNMDGTVRPLNWAVYGQYCDINGFDPYPVTYYGADHAYVRESLRAARQCCAPTPMYAILEAYGWSTGQGVPSKARGPVPAEYRQNVVQAIGEGMKGLSSWVYVQIAGGWQLRPEFGEEIARMNRLIEHVEDELTIGTPVDLASTDAGLVNTGTVGEEYWPKERVWAGAVLCGPDTLVVAVANHIPASETEPETIEPAENVTVTIDLPAYLRNVTAHEVTEDGVSPIPCRIEGDKALITVERIESGRVFMLRRTD